MNEIHTNCSTFNCKGSFTEREADMSTLREKQLTVLRLFERPEPHVDADAPERDIRLSGLGRLAKNVIFSGFNMVHLEEARELYEILYGKLNYIKRI
ncbi:UNVERIFIED_CONTAM: Hemocyanin alpha chain [Trichonephila clavipes]